MTCKSASYKKLKTRMRKSLGADKAYSVAVPLAKLLMEYSKKACKSEFNGEFFQNISQSAMDPCNMILGWFYSACIWYGYIICR